MNKREDKLFLYLGFLFIFASLTILVYYIYLNYKSERLFIESAENSITLTDSNSVLSPESLSNSIEDEAIEVLDSDQKVKKVVEYKNVMKIPDLGIKAYIYEGTTQEVLRYGLGHYSNTKKVGELGNCCVAGHSSVTYNCILNGVADLPLYSYIFVWDENGIKHTYYLMKKFVVEPTALEVLETTDTSRSFFTIITCTANGHKRLVLTCGEFTKEEIKAQKRELNKQINEELKRIANDDVAMFELYDFLNRDKK